MVAAAVTTTTIFSATLHSVLALRVLFGLRLTYHCAKPVAVERIGRSVARLTAVGARVCESDQQGIGMPVNMSRPEHSISAPGGMFGPSQTMLSSTAM